MSNFPEARFWAQETTWFMTLWQGAVVSFLSFTELKAAECFWSFIISENLWEQVYLILLTSQRTRTLNMRSSFLTCSSAMNKEIGEEVAIKKIATAFANRIDAKRTLREIKILRHMNHDNVCNFASLHLVCSSASNCRYKRHYNYSLLSLKYPPMLPTKSIGKNLDRCMCFFHFSTKKQLCNCKIVIAT